MGKRQREALLKMSSGYFGNNNNNNRKQQPRDEELPTTRPKKEGNNNNTKAKMPPVQPVAAVSTSSVIDNSISDEMLTTTINTLEFLQKNPDLFRGSSRYKRLRSAIFPLCNPAPGGYSARISDAVSDGRWEDAILAVAGMRKTGEIPKLGSVQRWVRDCDAIDTDTVSAWKALDAILRVSSPDHICTTPTDPTLLANAKEKEGVVVRLPEFQVRPLQATPAVGLSTETVKKIAAEEFRVLNVEPGHKRRPPNKHEMILYTSSPNAVQLDESYTGTRKVEAPFIPCSMGLDGLFTPREAQTIIDVAETVGYTPDEPATDKNSVLAHNFVWMADEKFHEIMFNRCKKFLPQELEGAKLYGVNRRFRCYRYVPGAVYRPHIDGAWPQSDIDEDGEYQYDASNGKVLSKLTFLVYLNEGFEGGWTTYYAPAAEEGRLLATPVSPRVGCAMVFPHGTTAGCLLHEGSGVIKGAKYIIRTEVLYGPK